jgi:hypothetical protein
LSNYERAFFRAKHLEFIPLEQDRALVKDRLLGLVRTNPTQAKSPLAGIGEWLTPKERELLARDAVDLVLFHSREGATVGRAIIREAYTGEGRSTVESIIKKKISTFEQHNRTDKVKVLQELLDGLQGEGYDFEDIPF